MYNMLTPEYSVNGRNPYASTVDQSPLLSPTTSSIMHRYTYAILYVIRYSYVK